MKRKISIVLMIIILLILASFLTLGVINKTFFKTYYEVTNLSNKKVKIPLPLFSYFDGESGKYKATFSTIRSVKNIQNILNKYVEHLPSCYDESYFYDSKLDITIKQFYIENGSPLNKIYLEYDKGNYCENEFVLNNNWMTDIINNARIQEVDIKKCTTENNTTKCSDKFGKESDLKTLLSSFMNATRVENKKNIGIDETTDHYAIDAYYTLNGYGFTLSVFKYNNYLAFKTVDINDHPKNALYSIDADVNQLIANIYNKY